MSRDLSRFSLVFLVQPNIESQGNKLKLFWTVPMVGEREGKGNLKKKINFSQMNDKNKQI